MKVKKKMQQTHKNNIDKCADVTYNCNINTNECVDSARVIQVIETKSNRGKGTLDDLSRQVVQYWSLEGQLLAERDSHTTKNEQPADV